MHFVENKFEIITDKSQLTEFFRRGCKTEENIGVESEKLLVYKNDLRAVKYEDVVKVLESFDENRYEKIYENENLIGLKCDFGIVSLEPGSQTEISLFPLNDLNEINTKLMQFYSDLSEAAERIDAAVLNSGIQPVSTYNDINIIPKKRYEFMTKYLPAKGLTPFIMMRETAGIQVNFDYKSEEDAIRKLSVALKMSSFIAAIYANSPVRNSKPTGYKSFRANSWLNVDEQRCGLVNKKLIENPSEFSFDDYTDILLNVPMIFIERNGRYFETDITFGDFLRNGFEGLKPTLGDWETCLSLFFPDVRLKKYIEIRNHDAQNAEMTFSVPAFWKGIMYNPDALSEIENILSDFSYEDYMLLRKEVPGKGINAKIGDKKVIDLVKEFFDISAQSLKKPGKGEEKYLEPVFEYIRKKRMPADNIEGIYKIG